MNTDLILSRYFGHSVKPFLYHMEVFLRSMIIIHVQRIQGPKSLKIPIVTETEIPRKIGSDQCKERPIREQRCNIHETRQKAV